MRTSLHAARGLLALALTLSAVAASASPALEAGYPGLAGGGLTLTATVTPDTVPQGGTFSPTVSVTNNTGEDITADVWLTVAPGNATVLLRTARTFPAGFSAQRTYTHTIPADFRPGTYTVTVYAGDFGTGTVIASDSYQLTVTEARIAAGAASDVPAAAFSSVASAAVSPNPFSQQAVVRFALEEASPVRLAVYDVLGREVAVLVDGHLEAGSHAATLDGSGLPAGPYLVRLQLGDRVETQPVTLAR